MNKKEVEGLHEQKELRSSGKRRRRVFANGAGELFHNRPARISQKPRSSTKRRRRVFANGAGELFHN